LEDLAEASPIVIGLPRGGVPVAFEVARALDAPMDIAVVRKLGAPSHPEFGVGALAESGDAIVNTDSVRRLGITREELERVVAAERAELDRRIRRYRADRPPIDVSGRVVILTDDGLATGLTAIAVARSLRERGAAKIVLAVPICPAGVADELRDEFDDVFCLSSPQPFLGVGGGYVDFDPTSDQEVVDLLARSREGDGPDRVQVAPRAREVEIPVEGGVTLHGDLTLADDPRGLVIFAHGSGSSRKSRRNRAVATRLAGRGFATLLFDLLTDREAGDRRNVFDVGLLAHRLLAVTRWAGSADDLAGLPIGYFGASTGAAAALRAAAALGPEVGAVVSRGGRPDLAEAELPRVDAPTLLVVGGADSEVLALNRGAAELIPSCRLAVVPGAGHLFEEPGAMARVARIAGDWFDRHLDGERSDLHEPAGQSAAR
jgi:predicted phosphoribosyltransferase/dienelactone hydrolase